MEIRTVIARSCGASAIFKAVFGSVISKYKQITKCGRPIDVMVYRIRSESSIFSFFRTLNAIGNMKKATVRATGMLIALTILINNLICKKSMPHYQDLQIFSHNELTNG